MVVFGMALASAGAVALASSAPPRPAPREPVTVQELPPVASPAPPPVAIPPPAPQPPERALWQRPELYAWIALFTTMTASGVTVLYLRRPTRNVMRAAGALTAISAIFVGAALVAWLA